MGTDSDRSRRVDPAAAIAHVRSNVVVVMMHRFSTDQSLRRGVDPELLKRQIIDLRRRGWRFSSLKDVTEALAASERLPPTMALTIDDGYGDFIDLGAPALAAADCPATVFAASGFIDGEDWFWWDKLDYVLARGRSESVTLDLEGRTVTISRDGATDVGPPFVELLKTVPDNELRSAIDDFAAARGVALPASAPEEYRPASWSDLRAAAGDGFDVGPHTVTHPILAQVDDAQSEAETRDGWSRVQQEMGSAAVPIACYPNGTPTSFGDREVRLARACGLAAGVMVRNATALPANSPGADMFRIPRLQWSNRFVRLAARPRIFGATLSAYLLALRVPH